MLEYILGSFTLLSLYRRINFYLLKRKLKKDPGIKIIKGAEPFLIKKGKIGVLLIHSFTATPQEFKEVARYLSNKNITVYAPLLPGHGSSPECLFSVNSDDWILEMEKSLKLMEDFCDKIYVVGNSFGGNLAFLVANKSKKVKGIISIGAPFFFQKDPLMKTVLFFLRQIKLFKRKNYSEKALRLHKRNKRIVYLDVPLYSFKELLKTVKKSKEILPQINQDVLVLQSSEDEIVGLSCPTYICHKINSKKRKIVWIPNSYHVLIIDKNKNIAFREIYDFIS